jgi:SAM-dependent methyltransferase
MENDQMNAYTEAVKSGLYAKKTGLVGKYDNVRRYWEDEITRIELRPYIKKIIDHSQKKMKRLRILDIGCGSADGFELLTGIREKGPDLHSDKIDLITPEILGVYKGVDLNAYLLQQAREIYGKNPKMIFEQADFTKGLPVQKEETAYDLYFSSYGTCSHHNSDETLVDLLADIAVKTEDYAIILCDWLGRYSYEWQTLWTNNLTENKDMDYVVSYIYSEEERQTRNDKLENLKLRLICREEVSDIVDRASKKAGIEIKPLKFFDRSIFTGRHMDTKQYNPYAQPIRMAVNSLHETNLRTDLESLIINYVPRRGFGFLNNYFEYLQMCWNTLVEYTGYLLNSYDETARRFSEEPGGIMSTYPEPLQKMMQRMKSLVEGVGWLDTGLPRENIIEPHLGYSLRSLMMNLQKGIGCAHGLVGIFEVDKR